MRYRCRFRAVRQVVRDKQRVRWGPFENTIISIADSTLSRRAIAAADF